VTDNHAPPFFAPEILEQVDMALRARSLPAEVFLLLKGQKAVIDKRLFICRRQALRDGEVGRN